MRQLTTLEWILIGAVVVLFYISLILLSQVNNNPCLEDKCVNSELVLLVSTSNGERNWVNTHAECK